MISYVDYHYLTDSSDVNVQHEIDKKKLTISYCHELNKIK